MNPKYAIVVAVAALVTLQTSCSRGSERGAQEQLQVISAAGEGRMDAVRSFLASGGNPNVTNNTGQTALLAATIGKHADIVTELLARGANPNIADSMGQTPIFFAAYNLDLNAASALIGAGADVNSRTQSGEFALLRAVTWGNSAMVELLVKGGADMTMKPTDERVPSPLKIATEGQMTEIAATLRNAGAKE